MLRRTAQKPAATSLKLTGVPPPTTSMSLRGTLWAYARPSESPYLLLDRDCYCVGGDSADRCHHRHGVARRRIVRNSKVDLIQTDKPRRETRKTDGCGAASDHNFSPVDRRRER